MDIDFLFSSFPFICNESVNLSQLSFTDEDNLSVIFNENGIDYNPESYIQSAENAFSHRRYIDIGYYPSDNPNYLMGILSIRNIDYKLNSVEIEMLTLNKNTDITIVAIKSLVNYLFSYIHVEKITFKKVNANESWRDTVEKSDFILEGCIRKSVYLHGDETGDMYIYGMIQSDFDDLNKADKSEEISDDTVPEEVADEVSEVSETIEEVTAEIEVLENTVSTEVEETATQNMQSIKGGFKVIPNS